MTEIAIVRSRWSNAQFSIGVLLVLAGLVAGFGLAQVVSTADLSLGTTGQSTTISLSADPAYLSFRAGERAGGVLVDGNAAYQAQRTGEREVGSSTGSVAGPGADEAWQVQRTGERGGTP